MKDDQNVDDKEVALEEGAVQKDHPQITAQEEVPVEYLEVSYVQEDDL
jgi:hypothetical protein